MKKCKKKKLKKREKQERRGRGNGEWVLDSLININQKKKKIRKTNTLCDNKIIQKQHKNEEN